MFKMIDYIEVKDAKDIPSGPVCHEEIENKKHSRVEVKDAIKSEEDIKMKKITLNEIEDKILEERLQEVEDIKEIPNAMGLENILLNAFQNEFGITSRDLELIESLPEEEKIDMIIETLGLTDKEVLELSEVIDRIGNLIDVFENSENLQDRFGEEGFSRMLLFRSLDSVLDVFETVFAFIG